MSYTFAVIVKTPSGDERWGNLATALDVYRVVDEKTQENHYRETVIRLPWDDLLTLRTEVFHVGEILILNEDGREVGYPGRKPRKWHVEVEEFDDLEKAIARSKEVFEESLRSQAAKDDA